MKDQIKELRLKIDGLAQLTKGLKPFKRNVVTGYLPKEVDNEYISEIIKVSKVGSILPKYIYHTLWITNEGTFRIGSNKELITAETLEKEFKVNFNSKEIEKAVDSLYLAKAWLGKVLEELGTENPYQTKIEVTQEWHEDYNGSGKWNNPVGWETDTEVIFNEDVIVTNTDKYGHPIEGYYIKRHKTKEDIEPTRDVAPTGIGTSQFNESTYNNKNHIEKVDWLRTQIKNLLVEIKIDLLRICSTLLLYGHIEQHLSEARFWLGFELGRIKQS